VNAVNDAPTAITLSNATLAENNAANATVGTLTSTDVDVGDTFTYSLGGTDAASFAIVGNTLQLKNSANFESKTSYSISITTTDSASAPSTGSYSSNFTISITNVNEAPTALTLTATSINENNAVNATVATLTGSDPDAGTTFTYSILAGGDGASFNISSNLLRASAAFNFEAKRFL